MNPTDYITLFWAEDEKHPFSANETRLYFYLLNRWVKQADGKAFELSTHQLEVALMLPKMTISRCRDKLSQRGLIQYVKGDRKVKNPCYFLCGVTNDVTNSVTNTLPKCDQYVTNPKEKVSPTPPLKENNIYNNKENSSNEELKKGKLSSPTSSERMDWGAFMQTFNDMLAPAVPKIQTMSESRRQRVKAIVKEFGKTSIMTAFEKIRTSDFLMGHNKTGWHCDFDWIFKKNNFIKILEGNYDNGASNNQINGQLCINSGAVQDQQVNIYREVFGYDGPPEKFEEWLNRNPYGG